MQTRRSFLQRNAAGLVVVGGLGSALAACGDDKTTGSADTTTDDAGLTAADVANASGTLKALAWSFYQAPKMNSGPVKAKFTDMTGAGQMYAAIRRGSLDLINPGANAMLNVYEIGGVAPIPTNLLKNYERIPAELRNNPRFSKDGQVYAVPIILLHSLLAYDSDAVSEPTSLEMLLEPEYEGKIGLYDDAVMVRAFAVGLGKSLKTLTKDDVAETVDYMKQLKPSIRTLYGFGEDTQLLGSGEIAVSLWSYGSTLTKAQKARPSIKSNLVSAVSYVDCWAVMEGADMAAALNFIDHSLAPAVQRDLSVTSGALAAVEGASDPSVLPEVSKDLTIPEILEKAPVDIGQSPVPDGDLATTDEVDAAWADFKGS